MTNTRPNVHILGNIGGARATIFTPEAIAFTSELVRVFAPRVRERLAARKVANAAFQSGSKKLDFLPETAAVRSGNWTCAPLPSAILERRVEITGPVDRKMIINALNSGANVFMADFEDANSPTWDNCADGQVNLRDAIARTIEYASPEGKTYKLGAKPATLFVRPRGFHLSEKHFLVDGQVAPGGLFDFGFYFFHNAQALLNMGAVPCFYLPKMEHHLEARLWNDVFVFAQKRLGIAVGTIKATCLIETLPGAFQMDEILHELRDHSAGLNCGRWDYIFSYIKTNLNDASRVLPDRSLVTMTQPFMRAYSQLLIKTCHKRGVHAMGGMAAQIPVKNDDAANQAAFEKVRADKQREVDDGHDGTWVAHPALVGVAKEVFDAGMKTQNQITSGKQATLNVAAADLLRAPDGAKTENTFRHNTKVAVQYIEAWLRGSGAVPLYNLMEDAATAEISRTQNWQWIRHGITLDTGKVATREFQEQVLREELQALRGELGDKRVDAPSFQRASEIFLSVATDANYVEFLTLPGYAALA